MANSWAFMAPWWQILQTHSVHAAYGKAGGVSGLAVFPVFPDVLDRNDIEQRCRALRDALELVFLLSVVDWHAFIKGLVKHDQSDFKACLKERLLGEGGDFPWYVAMTQTFRISNARTWIRVAVSTILKPQRLQERDQEFQDARQQLLRSLGDRAVYDKLKITVGFRVVDWTLAMRYLADLVRTGPPPAADYPFRFIILNAVVGQNTVSDQLVADIATCLGDQHKRIRFGSVRFDLDNDADGAKCGNLLSILLPSVSDAPTVEEVKWGTGIQRGLGTQATPHLVTQFCSALMYSRGVASLTLGWDVVCRRDRTRLMRWIVLSLFSSRACHSIRELTLNEFFVDDDDMDDLETCLRSQNPLGILRGDKADQHGDSQSDKQVYLAKGTNVLLNPVGTRPVATKFWKPPRLECGGWMDVVVEDAGSCGHCEVLVPGYGLCRAWRDDVQSWRVIDQRHDHQPKHGIKSLTLTWSRQESGLTQSALCRFLYLVGEPLEALSVSRLENVTTILDTMWTACPSLVRFTLLRVDSDCLRQISESYESGKCRVSSLAVLGIERQRVSSDILDFCEKLCDPELLISRTLTELSLGINPYRTVGPIDLERAAILRVLECNTKLVFSSIWGMGLRHRKMRFTAHNNQPLPGQGVPLAQRAKLAFLSAVLQRGTSGESETRNEVTPAITVLDSDVIGRIFELAARPVRRKIWVEENS